MFQLLHFSGCRNGLWICTLIVCPKTCSVVGNQHFNTFDGFKYTYQGAPRCSYVLVRVSFLMTIIACIFCLKKKYFVRIYVTNHLYEHNIICLSLNNVKGVQKATMKHWILSLLGFALSFVFWDNPYGRKRPRKAVRIKC